MADHKGNAAGSAGHGPNGKLIEEVMALAVIDCMAECISDPDEIRARKLAARHELKALFRSRGE